MKHILSIQDLSCVGKCGLTVALPVLSAMGHSCSVLPTAVLSTHTGFPNPHIHPLTEDILPVADHWKTVGTAFDAISVGYLADPRQQEMVSQVLDQFHTLTVIDPVLGDQGQYYHGLNREHMEAMRRLCSKGTYLLPNLTEAALLTDLPYRPLADETYLEFLVAGMLDLGAEGVVITGVHWEENSTGFVGATRQGGNFYYEVPKIPKITHGNGDLFTAVVTGALMHGADLQQAATIAAQFVERTVDRTPKASPYGLSFEKELPWLVNNLEQFAK